MAEFMTGLKRTDYCSDLRIGDVGREVTVCGWVQRCRDLGQLIFIDLRDRTGIVQLAFNDKTDKEIFDKAFACRSEYVLAAVLSHSSTREEICEYRQSLHWKRLLRVAPRSSRFVKT